MPTVKFKNMEAPLIGQQAKVGDKISATVTNLNLEDKQLGQFETKYTIFSIFPSINTSVCDEQTRMISKLAMTYPNYDFVALSLDLPTALGQWCSAHSIANLQVYSDYKHREFSKKYGLLIEGPYLMNRAVFVVDKNGTILYAKHNTDVRQQIDIDDLESFLKTTL